jgi:hypothetical protein
MQTMLDRPELEPDPCKADVALRPDRTPCERDIEAPLRRAVGYAAGNQSARLRIATGRKVGLGGSRINPPSRSGTSEFRGQRGLATRSYQ